MSKTARQLRNGATLSLVERLDGWVDTLTGLGDPLRDKRLAGGAFPVTPLLSYTQLTQLYRSSDVAAKIIEKPVQEMMRPGYAILVNDDEGEDLQDSLLEEGLRLDIDGQLEDTERWARAFGGGLLVCGLNDGQEMSLPLDETRLQSIDYLTPLNRYECLPFTYYRDPFAPNYGKPETFLINSPEAGFVSDAQLFSIPLSVREALWNSKEFTLTPEQKRAAGLTQTTSLWNRVVHETRVLRLNGVRTTRFIERANQGWGDSVLIRVWETVRDFEASFQAVAVILKDFAQATYKVKGLTDIVGSPNGSEQLGKRLAAIDMARSVLRAVVIDADGEEFERSVTPLSGIPEMLDRFTNRLANAADIPVTILMGEAPAGLNATGDSDVRNWYARIAQLQATRMAPLLARFYRWLAIIDGHRDIEGLKVVFNPLFEPTDAETATTRYTVAQGDQIYIANGVLSPSQVAKARFGGTEYSMDIALSPEDLNEMEAAEGEQDDLEAQQGQLGLKQTQAEIKATQAKAAGSSIDPSTNVSQQTKKTDKSVLSSDASGKKMG